jgi:hypothetical protein
MTLVPCSSGIKQATEIAAADLADLLFIEAGLQHRIYICEVETYFLVRPGFIGALAGPAVIGATGAFRVIAIVWRAIGMIATAWGRALLSGPGA